jgi:hypothetical protein
MSQTKKKTRIILTVLYTVYLVVVFEASARLAYSIPQVSRSLQGYDSLSWHRRWIKRHQKTGIKIYYKFDIYDPSKGWVSKPHLRDMKISDNKILNTNSTGLRGKTDYNYGRNDSRVRILTLGDSFTFGDEVSDNETYPYYLQQLIPNAEVINLGMHGYGHDQMLIFLREEGVKYKPDIIILGFLPMDMHRNLLNFRDYAKPKFILDNKKLSITGSPVPTPEEVIKWDWIRPRIIDIFSFIRYRLRRLSGAMAKEEEVVTTAILTEIINVAKTTHAIPIFVYLPSGREIFDSAQLTLGEKYLSSMCQRDTRVRCFSARPHFAEKMASGVTFKHQKEGHWGPAANLAIAEAIKRYLVDEGYVGSHDNASPISKGLHQTRGGTR